MARLVACCEYQGTTGFTGQRSFSLGKQMGYIRRWR
jgi:hypothetical protein